MEINPNIIIDTRDLSDADFVEWATFCNNKIKELREAWNLWGEYFEKSQKKDERLWVTLREEMKENLPERVFYEIFEYGNENSGYLMYNRYKQMGLEKFVDDLCQIDLWKWEDYWKKRNGQSIGFENMG